MTTDYENLKVWRRIIKTTLSNYINMEKRLTDSKKMSDFILVYYSIFLIIHSLFLLRIGLEEKLKGGLGYVHEIYPAAVQGGHLSFRRAAAGIYLRCAGGDAGGAGLRHCGAGAMQIVRAWGKAVRFSHSLELYPQGGAGYCAGGCPAGGLPGAQAQDARNLRKRSENISEFFRK